MAILHQLVVIVAFLIAMFLLCVDRSQFTVSTGYYLITALTSTLAGLMVLAENIFFNGNYFDDAAAPAVDANKDEDEENVTEK